MATRAIVVSVNYLNRTGLGKNIKKNILILLLCSWPYAYVQYQAHPVANSPFSPDSLWVGAGLIAQNSDSNIIVTWKKYWIPFDSMLAEVYYIAPGFKDTAQFLFHDLIGRFPEENSTVDIGKYPEGTPIFFLFIVTDTSYKYEYYKGKKKYTGQNRDSVDILVTDAPGNNAWGKNMLFLVEMI